MRQLRSTARHGFTGSPILVLALLTAAVAVGAAQPANVVGQVYEPGEGAPVEYANVVLYRATDSTQVTGATTDAAGRFELPGVGAGQYYLEVSFIGYAARRVDDISIAAGAQVDLGRLALEPLPVPVEGVEAVGEKPAVRYELDKKVIEVGKLPNAASGTAVDALENAPSVTVDIEGNVSLRGSRNFTVLVDGKPTMLEPSEALRTIPAGAIDRIEIITNPSAKYDPEGAAGIINVIMKKQRVLGISSLANLNGAVTQTFGGDLLLGYRQGIVNTHAGADFNRRRNPGGRTLDNVTFTADETTRTSSTGDGCWLVLFGGGRAGAEFSLGSHDRSSVSGMYRAMSFDNSTTLGYEERYLPADTGRSFLSTEAWTRDGDYVFLSADHTHDFDTSGHKLLAQGWLGRMDGTNRMLVELADTAGTTTSGRRTVEAGPTFWSQLEADYTLPLRAADKLEAGYEARIEGLDQNYLVELYSAAGDSYATDSTTMHLTHGRRYNHSVYGTYSWSWRGLGLQPGMRAEYGTQSIVLAGENVRYDFERWDVFPTAHASLGLPAEQQLTFSYSRRIERPDPYFLRPFETSDGASNASRGNPELLPEDIDSWEAGYGFRGALTAGLYCRFTHNLIDWTSAPYPGRPGTILSTAANVGTDRQLGGELQLGYPVTKSWNVNLSGNLYDYRLEVELDSSYSRHSFNWDATLNTDYTLPTHTRLQLMGYYSGPSASVQGRQGAYFVTSIAARQDLLGRALSITLRVRDLFGTGRWESRSEGDGFSSYSRYTSQGRVLSLALTWNFNNFRFSPKMRQGEGMEMQGAPQR